jgi:protein-tyrosine phosphatase
MGHAVLLVCTANICRSPMAEGALRTMLGRTPRSGDITVASVGTHSYHAGEPAFPLAIEAARARGYDIQSHVARQLLPSDFDRYDAILAMDRYNMANLRAIAPTRAKSRIELLLEYGEKFYGGEVPDPIGKPARDFELALDMIEDGCRGLIEVLGR